MRESVYNYTIKESALVNDQILHTAQQLIKQIFPTVRGLQDPILSETLTFDVQRSELIQVVNSGKKTGSSYHLPVQWQFPRRWGTAYQISWPVHCFLGNLVQPYSISGSTRSPVTPDVAIQVPTRKKVVTMDRCCMGWTVFKRTSYVLRSFAVEFPTNWMDQDHLLHVQIPGRRRGQRRRHLGEAEGQDEETDIMQNISYRYTRRKHVSVKTLLLPLR